MKKLLLLMLGAMVALVSCQKDADLATDGDGGMVDVAISVAMDGASATTRVIENYGTGTTVDRCIMEVYCDNVLYKRMVSSDITTTSGTITVDFDLRLVASKTYDFLFWADKDNNVVDDAAEESYDTSADGGGDKHYTTTNGLKAVTAIYTNYAGSDEARDAFFGTIQDQTISSSIVLDATLTRPFGQLNVSTYLTDVPSEMYPKSVKIKYITSVGDTFNVLDGTVGGTDATIEWDVTGSIETSLATGETLMHLSTDYLFASDTEQDLHNFEMTFYSDDSGNSEVTTNDNFKNIPIQRNYRTNVSGELLTKQGTVNVTIDPIFENNGSEDYYIIAGIYEVATADKVWEILSKTTDESVHIRVNDDSSSMYIDLDDSSNTISSDVKSITLEFTNSADGSIYIGKGVSTTTGDMSSANESSYSETLNIILEAETTYLYVNTPNAHVEYQEGSVKSANVNSDANTFVILSAASIGTLTVEGGNVEVHGTVGDDADGSGSDNSGGIIISATNQTTTSIEVYGTVDEVSVESSDSTTSPNSITITIYEGGDVTGDIDSSLDVSYEVMEASDSASFVTAMECADIINITQSFTLGSAITNTTAKVINGNDYTITINDGSVNFTCEADLTVNNLTIDANVTTLNTGVFSIGTSNVALALNYTTIDLATQGGYSTGYPNCIRIYSDSNLSGIDVTVSNSTFNLEKTYQYGINVFPSSATLSNSSVSIIDSKILSPESETSNATYSVGVSVSKADGLELLVSGSELKYMYYPISFTQTYIASNIDLDIIDSSLAGYCAMHLRSDGGTVDIVDSTLEGRNFYTFGSNDFATIVYGYDSSNNYNGAANDITMTLDNTTISNHMSNTAHQYGIDMRENNSDNTIIFKSGCKFIDNVTSTAAQSDFMICEDYAAKNNVYDGMENVELQGKSTLQVLNYNYLTGEGTETSPYLIYGPYDMMAIGHYDEEGGDKYFEIMDDIDFGDISTYSPTDFFGHLNGNDKTISNLAISQYNCYSTWTGLFQSVDGGEVTNVILDSSCSIDNTLAFTYTMYVGSIAGVNWGDIKDCQSAMSVKMSSTGSQLIGGIAGVNDEEETVISGNTFSGTILFPNSIAGGDYYNFAAGIVGYNFSGDGESTISNNTFSGIVNAVYPNYIAWTWTYGNDDDIAWSDDSNTYSAGTLNSDTSNEVTQSAATLLKMSVPTITTTSSGVTNKLNVSRNEFRLGHNDL